MRRLLPLLLLALAVLLEQQYLAPVLARLDPLRITVPGSPVQSAIWPLLAPLIMAGGSAIAGWLANRGNKQTTMPELPENLSPLQDVLVRRIQGRLAAKSALPEGYEEGQLRDINNTYGLVQQGLANNLTARGLGTSPIAGAAETKMGLGRAGDVVRMQASLPMVERQFEQMDLSNAQNLLNSARGVQTTQVGSPAGGAATNMMQMLAYLYGKGAFGGSAQMPPSGFTNGGAFNVPAQYGVSGL